MTELWDLYDVNRNKTGKTHQRGIPVPDGYYHLVVEIWTIIGERILLTQRHPDKPYGLFWECTGGSVIKGENSKEGALREVKEEIGLHLSSNELMYIFTYISGNAIYDVYINYQKISCIEKLNLQKEEVVDKKIVSLGEFNELILRGEIVPKLVYFNKLVQNGDIRLTTAST